VPVDDPQALAKALVATLRNPPDTRQSQARAQSFSVAAAARRYLDVLEG
jgi:hypothetical protein